MAFLSSYGAPNIPPISTKWHRKGRNVPAYRFPDTKFSYYVPVEDHHRAYVDMIRAMDEGIGRILEKVGRESLQENTLIIFFLDNGGLAEYSYKGPFKGQ